MRILWISPRWPLPDNDGARKATLALLRHLQSLGKKIDNDFKLDVVFIVDEKQDKIEINDLEKKIQFESILLLKKPNPIFPMQSLNYIFHRAHFSKLPFTVNSYSNSQIQNQLTQWSINKSWDFTIIDGLHAFALIPQPVEKNQWGELVYRAHNLELELWRQLEVLEKNIFKKMIWSFEYKKIKDYELNLAKIAKKIFTVSELDKDKFLNLAPDLNVQSLKIGMEMSPLPLEKLNSSGVLKLLFIGRLDWYPNKQGLQWFLNDVWPQISKKKKVELTVIGSGDSSWLKNDSITVLRNVPELLPYYRDCHASIIPLFIGSGTRVKAIESASFGRSFLTTALGVEGLPFVDKTDYLSAETAEEWINALIGLECSDWLKMGESIFERAKNNFDSTVLTQQFLRDLKN